jgi:hypothetical protein
MEGNRAEVQVGSIATVSRGPILIPMTCVLALVLAMRKLLSQTGMLNDFTVSLQNLDPQRTHAQSNRLLEKASKPVPRCQMFLFWKLVRK